MEEKPRANRNRLKAPFLGTLFELEKQVGSNSIGHEQQRLDKIKENFAVVVGPREIS
jgi:hypothetical protein